MEDRVFYEVLESFQAYDFRKSGGLTSDHLHRLLYDIGLPLSREVIDEMVKINADTNVDKPCCLDYTKFLEWVFDRSSSERAIESIVEPGEVVIVDCVNSHKTCVEDSVDSPLFRSHTFCDPHNGMASVKPFTIGKQVISSSETAFDLKAQRPAWLATHGRGQANVDPTCWALSVEQFVWFIRACKGTEAWNKLWLHLDDEYNVNMYHVNEHFVVPWTSGTGNSIALLMNSNPQPAELMVSHAWSGSVIETYNSLQNFVNFEGAPSGTYIFFCTLCLYQPEDAAAGGLSIDEQLSLKPFANIIRSDPLYGMRVVHTTLFEVYLRLWTVHEVDEAILAGVDIRGLFDIYRWNSESLQDSQCILTSQSSCRPEDLEMLTSLVESRGGFERLDKVIFNFRERMFKDFQRVLETIAIENSSASSDPCMKTSTIVQHRLDWEAVKTLDEEAESYKGFSQDIWSSNSGILEIQWKHFQNWTIRKCRPYHECSENIPGCASRDPTVEDGPITAYPLGYLSYPLGFPVYMEVCGLGGCHTRKGAELVHRGGGQPTRRFIGDDTCPVGTRHDMCPIDSARRFFF